MSNQDNNVIISKNNPLPDYLDVSSDEENIIHVSVSQKGGHIVLMNSNRNVATEIISQEDNIKIPKQNLSP